MILSIVNKKGGVGKTPISFSLAKDLGYYLQSNDNSVIESIYPDMAKITESPSLLDDCVFDFGGFTEGGVLSIIKASDAVLIPCSIDYNSILRTVETIEEIQPHAKALFVIVTKTEKEGDFQTVKDAITQHFDEIEFFELRLSKVFKNAIETGLSVTELYNESPLSKNAYKTVYKQYSNILNMFKNS
ncbi:MAG: ParA family protein [Sulfuricurvum sp.]|jgi:cellulose biosynthesis protein BcsQ|uniref:nucleotide-binding protein n=1 Tax=Sulfuricurvum sp. TaxID=2025608 RepID=UPI0025E33336|nr:ParA family protein [Sulfuricurvum sp.]MCK9373619.1 ParA family protein [Sulfuricurvum sp.]